MNDQETVAQVESELQRACQLQGVMPILEAALSERAARARWRPGRRACEARCRRSWGSAQMRPRAIDESAAGKLFDLLSNGRRVFHQQEVAQAL